MYSAVYICERGVAIQYAVWCGGAFFCGLTIYMYIVSVVLYVQKTLCIKPMNVECNPFSCDG